MKNTKFKDFITLQRGFDLLKKNMKNGPFPVIGSTSVIGYHDSFKVEPPGVITGRSGSLGTVQYSEKRYWPHNTALWVRDFKGNFPLYVYYFLKTIDLSRFNAGVGVPTLNRNHLNELEISVHKIEEQRKIAAILSAYDDLIENNTRRIKILEEMAQTLYRHWFVDYKFPGHENVRLVDSGTELGLVPEGWEVKRLGDVSENFDRKRVPLSSLERAKMQGVYPYYGAAKILDFINDYLFDGKYLLIAEDGSVISPNENPVLQLISGKFWVNNHAHIVKGIHPITTNYLYLSLNIVNIKPFITGAAQPKITQQNLNRIPIIVPEDILLKKFSKTIDALFNFIDNLNRKNSIISKIRDLMIPKLISGELDVSEMEISGIE